MAPLQAAKAHCPNFQVDGSCLGMYYKDDLSVDLQEKPSWPKTKIVPAVSNRTTAGNVSKIQRQTRDHQNWFLDTTVNWSFSQLKNIQFCEVNISIADPFKSTP
jgi:hypothetical protein